MKYSQNSGPQVHVIFYTQENLVKSIDLQLSETRGTSWELKGDDRLETLIFRWMEQYCSGIPSKIVLPLEKASFPSFTQKVLSQLVFVPFGHSLTYRELAVKIGSPKAARAVGGACGKNPFPLVVPCHRILAQNQYVGGFSCVVEVKKRLLKHENIIHL